MIRLSIAADVATPPPIERRPRCRVTVRPGTPRESKLPEWEVDLTPWLTRCRTVKALHSPVGTFELGLTFAPLDGRSLNMVLVPDNVVTIQFDRGFPGSTFETVMIGYICSVGVTTTLGGVGRVAHELVVTGQDAGKFLVRHELPAHLLTTYIQGDVEATRRLSDGLFVAGMVGEILRRLFVIIFQELLPAPETITEGGARLLTDPALDGEGPDALQSWRSIHSVWTSHGKFWSMFREFADLPWNEVWGDYIPDLSRAGFDGYKLATPGAAATPTPDPTYPSGTDIFSRVLSFIVGDPQRPGSSAGGYYVIARPLPFSQARWAALPEHWVWDTEIKYSQVSLSDDERINLVYVQPQGAFASLAPQWVQGVALQNYQFDKDAARRHATQGMSASTYYTDLGGTAHRDPAVQGQAAAGQGDITATIRSRARRLWDAFSINHLLHKGVWVIAGNPAIHIGQRVREQGITATDRGGSTSFVASQQERRTFYVERVVQDYVDGRHYLTHLALTRGQPVDQFVQAREPDPIVMTDRSALTAEPAP